jgi:hypothetical protein
VNGTIRVQMMMVIIITIIKSAAATPLGEGLDLAYRYTSGDT